MEQTTSTITELKAQAYDLIAQMEQYQNLMKQLQEKLMDLNKQIQEFSK